VYRFRTARPVTTVVTAVGLALSAAACGGDSDSGSGSADDGGKRTEPYVIGAVVPLSGVNQTYGDAYRQAIDLCSEYVNGSGDLDSEIEVKYVDGKGLPAPSVQAMNRLVNVDDPIAVLTGFSAPTKATAPIANQKKVPLFNGGASSPDLQGLGDYVFNNIPLADQQMPASVEYLAGKKGLKNWFVLYSNETLGLSVLKAIEAELPKAGGTVVGTAEISPTATDFGPQVAKIRQVKPEVIFLATTSGGQGPTIVRQIRAAGIDARLASYAGIDIPETLAEPGAADMVFTSQHMDYTVDQPLTKHFSAEFEKRYPGKTPTILQANYCSQVSIIAEAVDALEEDGAEVTGESLMKKIRDIGTFKVVGGEVTFLPDGTVNLPIDVRELHSGKLEVVDTYTPDKK
jgi:branched-chain amino acid transport system substrate-binding protein